MYYSNDHKNDRGISFKKRTIYFWFRGRNGLKKNRIAFLYMFFNDEPFEADHRQLTSFPDVTFTCQAH